MTASTDQHTRNARSRSKGRRHAPPRRPHRRAPRSRWSRWGCARPGCARRCRHRLVPGPGRAEATTVVRDHPAASTALSWAATARAGRPPAERAAASARARAFSAAVSAGSWPSTVMGTTRAACTASPCTPTSPAASTGSAPLSLAAEPACPPAAGHPSSVDTRMISPGAGCSAGRMTAPLRLVVTTSVTHVLGHGPTPGPPPTGRRPPGPAPGATVLCAAR